MVSPPGVHGDAERIKMKMKISTRKGYYVGANYRPLPHPPINQHLSSLSSHLLLIRIHAAPLLHRLLVFSIPATPEQRVAGCRAGTKIRRPAQRPEDVADVVRRLDALLEDFVPVAQDAMDNGRAGQVDVLDGGHEAALVGVEQVVEIREAWVGAVEVRGRAHEDDAREVDGAADGGSDHGLERCVVFLRRHAVHGRAVREERRRVLEGFTQELSGEVHIAGRGIAGDDSRGSDGGSVTRLAGIRVMCTVGLGRRGIVQLGSLCKANGQIAQCLIDLEDFGSVDASRVLVRCVGALRHISRGEILRDLSCVKLVLQRDLNRVFGQGNISEGALLWVDACDSGDQEVCLGKVE